MLREVGIKYLLMKLTEVMIQLYYDSIKHKAAGIYNAVKKFF
jgi:hypothetical protein